MATSSRTRRESGRTSASNKRTRIPLSRRVATIYGTARTSLPEIAGTPRFRRELLGVALVLTALLSAYVIGRGGDEGRLVAWWGSSLDRSLGRAAFLVPVLIALAALRALGGQPGRVLEGRHYLGGFAFTVAVVGLLQLGVRSAVEPAGGALGSEVATLAVRFLGPFGAGLALFAAGVLAIFLLAGSDFQTFCDDVRALLEASLAHGHHPSRNVRRDRSKDPPFWSVAAIAAIREGRDRRSTGCCATYGHGRSAEAVSSSARRSQLPNPRRGQRPGNQCASKDSAVDRASRFELGGCAGSHSKRACSAIAASRYLANGLLR